MTAPERLVPTGCRAVLITGAGRRLGASISETLHGVGYDVLLHYRQSADDAEALCSRLNQTRADSARVVQGDLRDIANLPSLVGRAAEAWGGLAALINNASAFYPTPFATASPADWDDLMTTNLKAPFFLCQAAAPYLAQNQGSIVNIGDIHAERTLPDYSIYSITKAGLAAMTKSLAKELAPRVRVNGVAPGAILWPEATADPATEERVLTRVPLGTTGRPTDIADAVAFLLDHAPYVTGQMLNVDGGRSLFS